MKARMMFLSLLLAAVPAFAETRVHIGVHLGDGYGYGYYPAPPPPPPVYVYAPPCPGPEYVWVPAYRYRVGVSYRWHDGYWAAPHSRGWHDGPGYGKMKFKGHGDHGHHGRGR